MAHLSTLGCTARAFAALSCALFLGACGTDKPKSYGSDEFHATATNVYSHKFEASAVATCEAARRALLSQGYVVADVKADIVNGQKSFQPDGETHVEIAFHVVCITDDKEGKNSTAFVNALQDRYSIKKTPSSASLGVGAVGAVSLPFGSSDDSLVKVASETIPPGPMYDRFFTLTGNYLAQMVTDFGPEPVHAPIKLAEPAPKVVAPSDTKAPVQAAATSSDHDKAAALSAPPAPPGALPASAGEPGAAGASSTTTAAAPGAAAVQPLPAPGDPAAGSVLAPTTPGSGESSSQDHTVAPPVQRNLNLINS